MGEYAEVAKGIARVWWVTCGSSLILNLQATDGPTEQATQIETKDANVPNEAEGEDDLLAAFMMNIQQEIANSKPKKHKVLFASLCSYWLMKGTVNAYEEEDDMVTFIEEHNKKVAAPQISNFMISHFQKEAEQLKAVQEGKRNAIAELDKDTGELIIKYQSLPSTLT